MSMRMQAQSECDEEGNSDGHNGASSSCREGVGQIATQQDGGGGVWLGRCTSGLKCMLGQGGASRNAFK
jgi:hypothetical protein